MVGTQDSRVLTHVGTRPARVQAEERDPHRPGLAVTWVRGRAARHYRGVPRDDPLARGGGRGPHARPARGAARPVRPRPVGHLPPAPRPRIRGATRGATPEPKPERPGAPQQPRAEP